MKNCKFDIYVGERLLSGQSDDIVVVVVPKFYIPSGYFELDGKIKSVCNMACFKKIDDAGTYIADWIELFGNEKNISANIVLNIQSLHKVFIGKSIIDVLDKINSINDYKRIRKFSELI